MTDQPKSISMEQATRQLEIARHVQRHPWRTFWYELYKHATEGAMFPEVYEEEHTVANPQADKLIQEYEDKFSWAYPIFVAIPWVVRGILVAGVAYWGYIIIT